MRRGRFWTTASRSSSRRRFADIFYNNCFKNGILPIKLSEEQVEELFQRTAKHGRLQADGRSGEQNDYRRCTASAFTFDLDEHRRQFLLQGLDDIGLTLQHEDKISAYEATRVAF